MKSTELFELLGEIDDKFYEEARIPDEQHGVEVVSEHRPIRGFLGIFLPIAACVAIIAAVVIGADIISKNAGFVGPNNPDSELSSDAPFTSDSGVSSVETSSSTSSEDSSVPVQDNGEIRLEDYPPIDFDNIPDLKGHGLQTQIEQQDKTLQKATLETLKCGDYELRMLGEFIHVDSSDDPNKLYSYYLWFAISKDGKVISTEGPHTPSVTMGQGGFNLHLGDLIYANENDTNVYLEYYELNGANLVIFTYSTPDTGGYECTFFTINDEGVINFLMGDRSGIGGYDIEIVAPLQPGYTVDTQANTLTNGNEVYTFNVENFGLNPYDAIHYTTSIAQFDLSEYPFVDISEIPDAGADFYDTSNAIPKATLSQKQVGVYTLSLIAKNVRSNGKIIAEEVCSVISRDGRIIKKTYENGTGVRTSMLEEYELYELLPDAYEMKDGIVFGLDKKSVQLPGTPTYGTIKNDVMIEFTTSPLGYDERDPFDGTVSEANGKVTLLPEENALILDGTKYVFDFDNVTYTETITDAEELNISDYKQFDGNVINSVQPRVILDTKEVGGYKLYLLGNYVTESPAEEFPLVDFAKLYIAVEKGGKIVAQITPDTPPYLNGLALPEYLRPFEMKDGIGFVMYYSLDPWGGQNRYAMLYKLENDTITKLRYEYDFAPAPATGSAQYVGGDFKVDFEKNAIVDDKGTITIDFESNTYSRS